MVFRSVMIPTRWFRTFLLPTALLLCASALRAQGGGDEAYAGEKADHYANVRVLEGDATVFKGDVQDTLSAGVPIAEGDVVESHGRGVLQLADGTRVAFAPGTRFQVASLFRDDDPEHEALFRLDQGRLRISLIRGTDTRVRVDTPSGEAFMAEGANASLDVESDQSTHVQVHTGRIQFQDARDNVELRAGEQLTVYGDQDRLDRIRDFNTNGSDPFDRWCDSALVMHRGPSWDRVPVEIRAYSDELDGDGEWVYVDEVRNWCWRPVGVAVDWRPYWRGRWGAYPGGMTWISDEPWGYVTYHHGRWGWGIGFGWYWIPEVRYAPAWVAWQTTDAYIGWAPVGFYGRPVPWGYSSWGGGACWNIVDINFINARRIHTHTFDQPAIVRSFEVRPGGPHPAWHQGPLVIKAHEFAHPVEIQKVLRDPLMAQNRLHTYEKQTANTDFHPQVHAPEFHPAQEIHRAAPPVPGTPNWKHQPNPVMPVRPVPVQPAPARPAPVFPPLVQPVPHRKPVPMRPEDTSAHGFIVPPPAISPRQPRPEQRPEMDGRLVLPRPVNKPMGPVPPPFPPPKFQKKKVEWNS
jgi:hypothetical protein